MPLGKPSPNRSKLSLDCIKLCSIVCTISVATLITCPEAKQEVQKTHQKLPKSIESFPNPDSLTKAAIFVTMMIIVTLFVIKKLFSLMITLW